MTCWADNLLTGHGSEAISQVIQQIQQDWDQVQAAQAIATSIGLSMDSTVSTEDLNSASEPAYDPVAHSTNGSGV